MIEFHIEPRYLRGATTSRKKLATLATAAKLAPTPSA
jgi:hypothetical protein